MPSPVEDDIGDQPTTAGQVVPNSILLFNMVAFIVLSSIDRMQLFNQVNYLRHSAFRKPSKNLGGIPCNHNIRWYILCDDCSGAND